MNHRDILEELNLTAVGQQLPMQALLQPADEAEATILKHVSYEPIHIDDVGRLAGLPIAAVSSTLALMEIKGLVKQVGAMNYIRAREVPAGYGGGD